MLSFLRTSDPPKTRQAAMNPVPFDSGRSSLAIIHEDAESWLRGTLPPFSKEKPSIMQPPVHFHLYQDERFRIVSGRCNLFKDTLETPWKTLDKNDPDGLKEAVVPKMTYHAFQNASTTEQLVVDVSLTPGDFEREERFFRNFFGYQEDCIRAGKEPSPFQLMVFLKSVDTPLGFPIGFTGNILLQNFMTWWGTWVLGYKSCYPEYYEEKKQT
ncbi:hypothetical protein GQ53DRAFT_794136 [Thozetella sp. PMI_491]|nr:hypothetical protein GQ53DRAFT_794136 [Thozetella sp. PMI_491]